MTTYLLDTSIWLDYYEKRGRNGKIAEKLIRKIIEKDFLCFSDLHIKELKHLGYSIEKIASIFRIAKPDHSLRVYVNKEQIAEMRKLSEQRNVPKGDALHAILARDNDAILIATDKHFDRLRDISDAKAPEELS